MSPVSAHTAFEWALEIERNGEAFYLAAAAAAQDREVKTLFDDLAHQEQRHFRTFERMLAKSETAGESTLPDDYHEYLERALGAAFTGPDKAMQRIRQAADEQTALRAAMAFEKDTLLFFYDVADNVAPEQLAAVRAIIDEERDHLRQLSRVLQSGPWVP